MTRIALSLLVLSLTACGASDPGPKPESTDPNGFRAGADAVMPDTATVDGVLMISHSADAFARAPQLTIAEEPEVIISGGDDADYDLTHAMPPFVFGDGKSLVVSSSQPVRLMLFGADGKALAMIARQGEGPGDVGQPSMPLALGPDTALVFDAGNARRIWITSDRGIVASGPLLGNLGTGCFAPAGHFGDRFVAVNRCWVDGNIDNLADRLSTSVVIASFDLSTVDTVAKVPGYDMVTVETRYQGRIEHYRNLLRFWRSAQVAAWGGGMVIATGEDGYVLDLGSPVTSRILVAIPRRPVTAAMRQAQINVELTRLDEYHGEPLRDMDETRRQARESPFADSLPPYGDILVSTDDVLWVVDYIVPSDTVVTATGFRVNGPILARLTIPGKARPVWFGAGKVMLREEDEDGVVTFAVYAFKPRE